MRFLRALEQNYWSDMHDYVKNELGFNGLVTGTQLMNSPPSTQDEYPFTDAHAYWQHPTFPGEAWDSANWTVGNESMVNTLNNTIHQLAGQRIADKPFTVSEYQHASPNTFSSEAPLLIAAYGRSEEHTSELQSRGHLVCRLLLEKKNQTRLDRTFSRRAR